MLLRQTSKRSTADGVHSVRTSRRTVVARVQCAMFIQSRRRRDLLVVESLTTAFEALATCIRIPNPFALWSRSLFSSSAACWRSRLNTGMSSN